MSNDRIYWMGWEVPDDMPVEHILATWPEAMSGWWSGSRDGYRIWVGIVRGPDEEAAFGLVRSCYGESASRIIDRGLTSDITEKTEWGDRFEGAAEFHRELRTAVEG